MRGVTATALLLALSLSTSQAFAQEEKAACRASTRNLIIQVIRTTPDVQVFEFRGLDAKVGIALYNSLPPRGHERGDRFYIMMRPGAPVSHLIVGNADCMQDTAVVDRGTAGVIKQAIERAAAATSI